MRTLVTAWRRGSSLRLGSSTVALLLGCTPATFGFGDADEDVFATDDAGAELGGEGGGPTTGDDPGGDGDAGDGDPGDGPDGDGDSGDGEVGEDCVDHQVPPPVAIELTGAGIPAHDCQNPEFAAWVLAAEPGEYLLDHCPCNVPECGGVESQLSITQPDPDWLPSLEVGGCYYFYLYAEAIEPGVCRRSRLDIRVLPAAPLWYSTGAAAETLDVNGFTLEPVFAESCHDGCGAWEIRDVTFETNGASATLGQAESAMLGDDYQIVNWGSYRAESGECEGMQSTDVTAWTAVSTPLF
jgi:hypothetical protein